jgi:hypothetical protein
LPTTLRSFIRWNLASTRAFILNWHKIARHEQGIGKTCDRYLS